MGNKKEFDNSGLFLPVLLTVGGEELITIEDLSLSAHVYQLLPLAISQVLSDNREFDVLGYFHLFYSLLVEGSL